MAESKKGFTVKMGELHLERLDELVKHYSEYYRQNSFLDIKITKANVLEVVIVREHERIFGENNTETNEQNQNIHQNDVLLNPVPSVSAQNTAETMTNNEVIKSATKKSFSARLSESHLEKLEQLVKYYADYYRKSSPLDIRLTKGNVMELLIIKEYELVFGQKTKLENQDLVEKHETEQ